MRWLQLAAAAVAAVLVADTTGFVGASWWAAAIAVFIAVRWTFAAVGRTRYYYGRASAHRECGGCGRRIHRKPGDWIRHCYSCGWTAGPPGVRWLTHSVPAKQLRRTVVSPGLVVLVVAGVVLLGLVPVPALPAVDDGADAGPRDRPATTAPPIDPDATEAAFIEQFNEMRGAQGLSPAARDTALHEMGTAHAQNMARHGYVGHEQPDGTTIEGRYTERGLLPACRLPMPDSDRFYPGAENAAGSHVGEVRHDSGAVVEVRSPTDLAAFLLNAWMQSPPHRRVMTLPAVDELGLGVAFDGEDIYAAVEFC